MRKANYDHLAGQQFGRLTVTATNRRNQRGRILCDCVCSCGVAIATPPYKLIEGRTKSCGCLRREGIGVGAGTHGMSRMPEYGIWNAMKQRCYHPSQDSYSEYGGRGIAVCDRWLHSFPNFIEDMGRRPSRHHSIDRIDNEGHYTPDNCQWSTATEQANNRRRAHYLTLGLERRSAAEWARRIGVTPNTIHSRARRGWSDERILTTPPRKLARHWTATRQVAPAS